MIADALDRAVCAAVIDAEHAWCAASGARSAGRASSSTTLCAQIMPGAAADLAVVRQQAAAEAKILVAEDDARAGARRGQRGRKPGRSRADHQHVAEGEGLLVASGSLSPAARPSPAARRISGS